MLRLSHASWLVLPAALLGGCPMYSDGCITSEDCAPDYACDYPSGTCQKPVPPGAPDRCNTTSNCTDGEVCDRYHRCVTPSGAAGTGGTSGGAAGENGNVIEGGSAGGS